MNCKIQENENKCQRVHEKVIAETDFQKKNEQDIFDAKIRIESLEQLETDLKLSVHSLQPYHVNNFSYISTYF